MPYEIIAEKVKALPAQAVEEVLHYVDYITMVYVKDTVMEKVQNEKLDALKGIFGILSDEEADEMRGCCHIKFKEVEA